MLYRRWELLPEQFSGTFRVTFSIYIEIRLKSRHKTAYAPAILSPTKQPDDRPLVLANIISVQYLEKHTSIRTGPFI